VDDPGLIRHDVYLGILVETRVFGESLPFIAALGAIIAEESLPPSRAEISGMKQPVRTTFISSAA
jgi:hypothetical protein